MNWNRLLLLCLAISPALAEGPVSIGVRAGVPFRDLVEGTAFSPGVYRASTRQLLAGPTFAVNLPAGFAVQLDVLFRRYQLRAASSSAGEFQQSYTATELPLMLRWQAPGLIAPFINGGPTFRSFGEIGSAASAGFTGDFATARTFTTGFALGGGIRIKAGPLKIAPELRWSHFTNDNFRGGPSAVFETVKNQADFLVGFYF